LLLGLASASGRVAGHVAGHLMLARSVNAATSGAVRRP
jgi:hypothetical protein